MKEKELYTMQREEAKEVVKGYLYSYLEGKGCSTRKPFKCLNPQHTDGHPSMSYDRKRNKVHCFSCGADYDIIDLIGIDYGLADSKDAFEQAYQLYGISIDNEYQQNQKVVKTTPKPKEEEKQAEDLTDYFLKANSKVSDTDYLHSRGLSDVIISRFKLGYEEHFNKGTGGKEWKAVIIPTTKYTYTARNTAANIDKKDRIRKVGSNVLFNMQVLGTAAPVFVVEGELDALSIIEAGGEAVALGSTANYHKFVDYLKKRDIKSPLILLALDNDTDGETTAKHILEELGEYSKAQVVNLDTMYGECKDANELLCKDRGALEQAIENGKHILLEEQERLAEEYRKNNAAGYIDAFLNGIKESVNTAYIPTGFSGLDKALEGGLYEGLYIIGAISSLGKTTYIMQIADQIAQSGNDVLIFSLEMARTQLMAKSISRLTILDCMQRGISGSNAKTSRGITTGSRYANYSLEEKQIITKCVEEYRSFASNIYITEGIGNIGVKEISEAVKNHIAITGKKPVVIVDYLQILAPNDIRATDKQNTDKAVLELKRMSRDYKVSVIGISSLNRQSYNAPIGMEAFKESGAIEYSSDVLLGMQLKGVGTDNFDVNEAKSRNPREVEVVILKNRDGATGEKISYSYYPMFNYFEEDKQEEYIPKGRKGKTVYAPTGNGFSEILQGSTPFDEVEQEQMVFE